MLFFGHRRSPINGELLINSHPHCFFLGDPAALSPVEPVLICVFVVGSFHFHFVHHALSDHALFDHVPWTTVLTGDFGQDGLREGW